MATDLNTQVEGIKDEYKYGFHDSVANYSFKSGKGLTRETVEQISEMKSEPGWMRDVRLKALDVFWSKPNPTWGGELAELNYNDIRYFMRAADRQGKTWDDVPAEIKNTFDKLGIPEAERKFLAGVGAQYDSEVVYHSLRDDLQKKGVIFTDMDTALREHPDLVKRVLRHDHPDLRQQVRRAQHGGLVGRVVRLRPGRREGRHPAPGLLPDQRREHGPVRADPDPRRGRGPGPLRRGLHRADLHEREPALGRRRGPGQEGRPLPLHDDPELGEQHLQPGDQAGRRPGRRPDGVGRRQPRQPPDDEVPRRLHDRQGGPRRDPLDRLRRQGAAPGRRRQGRPRGPLHQLADHLQEHQQERRPGQLPRPAQGRRRRQGLEVERRLRRPDPRPGRAGPTPIPTSRSTRTTSRSATRPASPRSARSSSST